MYQYKMQLIFRPSEAYKILKIIIPKSLTYIEIMDSNLKRLDKYSGFIAFESGQATTETISYLKKSLKELMLTEHTAWIELYRTNK